MTDRSCIAFLLEYCAMLPPGKTLWVGEFFYQKLVRSKHTTRTPTGPVFAGREVYLAIGEYTLRCEKKR